jgi:hypothetical protein
MRVTNMKRLIIPVIAMLFLLCTTSSSFGDSFWRTYEVVSISDDSLMLVDEDGNQIEVNNQDNIAVKVGYKVRYDNVRKILKIDRWQDYTVRNVSSSSITLEHKTGHTITLGSGDVKTPLGKFKEGDHVSYDSVEKHLKMMGDNV